MKGWISIKDRLPEPLIDIGCTLFSDDVLAYAADDDEIIIDNVMYPHGVFRHDTTPRFHKGGYGKRNITHWMPLPNTLIRT